MELKSIEVTVSGRVQMVMFRDFVQRKATKLGLMGTVENKPDGTVHVVAEGDDTNLKKLIAYLHKGSVLSRVDDVAVTYKEPLGAFERFTITY